MIAFLLKWLPFLAKLGGAAKWFAFIPGGQVFAVIGQAISALFGAVAWFIKWLFADIADGFKEPQRFAVRIACMLIVFGVGGYLGIDWDWGKVEAARQETADLRAAAKKRDKADADAADHARKAREAAEHAERQRIAQEERDAKEAAERRAWEARTPAPAPAAAGVRVVPKRPATPAKAEPGLLGSLPAVFGFGR